MPLKQGNWGRRGPGLTIRDVVRAVNTGAEITQREIRGVLEENRVGRGVMWPGNRVPSSRDGDPPARQSGRLMESLKVLKRATIQDPTAEVGPDPGVFPDYYYPGGSAPYKVPGGLEFGTRRMAPRPFMRPGIERAKRKLR